MAHPNTYYDLLAAFKHEGCPVCRVAESALESYLEHLAYECVNDESTRERLRDSNGFCLEHSRKWLSQPRLLGTAIIYRDITENVITKLHKIRRDHAVSTPPLSDFQESIGIAQSPDPLAPTGECPACDTLATAENLLVSSLIDSMFDWDFEDAYSRSDGLCLPHLRAALLAEPDGPTRDTLIDVALKRQYDLHTQLEEIIRHFDPQLHDQPIGEEKGAHTRAVRFSTGAHPQRARKSHNWNVPVGDLAAAASMVAAGGYALWRRRRSHRFEH